MMTDVLTVLPAHHQANLIPPDAPFFRGEGAGKGFGQGELYDGRMSFRHDCYLRVEKEDTGHSRQLCACKARSASAV